MGKIDFGTVPVGGSRIRTLVLLNDNQDGVSVTVTAVSVTGAMFALVSGSDACTGMTLAYNATCSFDVAYRPTSTGEHFGRAQATFTGVDLGTSGVSLHGQTSVTSPSTHVSPAPPTVAQS